MLRAEEQINLYILCERRDKEGQAYERELCAAAGGCGTGAFGLSAKRNRPPCRAETDGLTELGNILIHIISYDDKKAREEFLSILDK